MTRRLDNTITEMSFASIDVLSSLEYKFFNRSIRIHGERLIISDITIENNRSSALNLNYVSHRA